VPRVKASALCAPDRKRILSSLRKHVKKPSRITFVIAAATVTTAAAVTAGAAAGAASPAAQAVPAGLRQPAALRSAELTSYAVPDRPLHIFRAHVALEQVQQIAAEARIAAERAAAQRAAARRAAARQAAANAAAAQVAPAQTAPAQTAAAQTSASSGSAQPSGSAQQIALEMLGSFGWSSSQFSCLVSLWNRESGWNAYASNPSSGAYGIPQALPGSKMASAGADWASNPATQIRWGLGYIQSLYGSPCAAWDHSQAVGWY
jgi:hypothetical protein